MSLPYDHHGPQLADCAIPLSVPVIRSQYSQPENWPQSLPEINDPILQSFSQLLALDTFQSIGTCAEDSSGETYASTPDSSYWSTASLSGSFAVPVIPSHDPTRRRSLPIDQFSRDNIQTVDEARRDKRRAQNRAAQHAFKARKRQLEHELCEKIKQVEEANAELRTQNAQLMAGLRQHVESKLAGSSTSPVRVQQHRNKRSTSPRRDSTAETGVAEGAGGGVVVEKGARLKDRNAPRRRPVRVERG